MQGVQERVISSQQVELPDEVPAPRVVQTDVYVHVGGAAADCIHKLPSSGIPLTTVEYTIPAL
jgi:hypothetical protein